MKTKQINKPLILSIPEPCSKNWDEMIEVNGGKFCSHCQKTVIDFSTFTDTEIYSYFKNSQNVPCGRFHHTQLNVDLQPQERQHQPWKIFYRKVAALLAFLTLRNAIVHAQTKEPSTVQPTVRKNTSDSAAQTVTISGIVKAEDGTTLENADISFDNKTVAKTLADGSFTFETTAESSSKSSVLKVSYPGLMAVVRSYHPAMRSTAYNITLEKPHFNNEFIGGWVVSNYTFTAQTFEQPQKLNGEFRRKLAEMAATFRNNPNASIQIAAYGTTVKEIKAARKILTAIKTYFVEKEGIGAERFYSKIKPMQKGKQRTFDVEPYIPE